MMKHGNMTPRVIALLAICMAAGHAAFAAVRVWNAAPLQIIDAKVTPPAGAALQPLELVVPRNGVASGQVVVSADAPLAGVQATMSDLAGPGIIPAAACRVRYAEVGKAFVPLLDAPVASAVQPVWVTVTAPTDAAPGRYTGTLTIRADAATTPVPVSVTVAAWRVPDTRQWGTVMSLMQSPESVAGYYGVPMWSDEHFRLLEPSIAQMAYLGNNVLSINAIGKTVFGNDPLILFCKEGDGYVPDFTTLDRYLTLYDKYAGAPHFLSVQVWHYDGAARGTEADPNKLILYTRAADGTLTPFSSTSEAMWTAVFDGVRARTARLGWTRTRLLLGTAGDTWPRDTTVQFWQRVAPDAHWRVLTHGCGAPMWGLTDLGRRQPNGMVVGYLEVARRVRNNRVQTPESPVVCSSRDEVGAKPSTYRTITGTLAAEWGYAGFCWKGLDYWTYTTVGGKRRNALNTDILFGTMVQSVPRAIRAPGPHGAVATQQSEMLREGMQETEASHAMRAGLVALAPPPQHCDVVELSLAGGLGPRDNLNVLLYFHKDGIGAIPRAPTYEAARAPGTATAKELPAIEGARVFAVKVTFPPDPFVDGGTGAYRVEVKTAGDAITGAYAGEFNGWTYQGDVTGTFRTAGYLLADSSPQSPLAQRAGAAVIRLLRAEEAARPDFLNQVADLYAAAADVEAARR